MFVISCYSYPTCDDSHWQVNHFNGLMFAASGRFHYGLQHLASLLLSFWRIRIVPVAIRLPDLPVSLMDL